jgi:hypothetical protein
MSLNHHISKEDQEYFIRDFVKGELAAVESYKKIIFDLNRKKNKLILLNILRNHYVATTYFTNMMYSLDINTNDSSGGWGGFVGFIISLSKKINHQLTLKTLIEGEKYGLRNYEGFLKDEKHFPIIYRHIKKVLIPNQKEHISKLNLLL